MAVAGKKRTRTSKAIVPTTTKKPKTSRGQQKVSSIKQTEIEPPIFTLTEIFEEILVHLPASNVLKLRGVSRTWAQKISNSLPLMQKLFLAPVKDDIIWLTASSWDDDRYRATIRHKVQDPSTDSSKRTIAKHVNTKDGEQSLRRIRKPLSMNGILFKVAFMDVAFHKRSIAHRASSRHATLYARFNASVLESAVLALSQGLQTSYDNMYLTQPPSTAATITWCTLEPGYGDPLRCQPRAHVYRECKIRSPSGITFRMVLESYPRTTRSTPKGLKLECYIVLEGVVLATEEEREMVESVEVFTSADDDHRHDWYDEASTQVSQAQSEPRATLSMTTVAMYPAVRPNRPPQLPRWRKPLLPLRRTRRSHR